MKSAFKKLFGTRKRKWFSIALLVLVLIILIAIVSKRNNGPLSGFEVASASRKDIIQEVSISGKVKPSEEVSLSLDKAGRVSRINYREGDSVRKGATILSVESGDISARLRQAQVEAERKKIEYEELLSAQASGEGNGAGSLETEVINAVNNLRNSLRNGYVNIDNAVSTYVDQFFDNPRGQAQFGVTRTEGNSSVNISAAPQEKIELNKEKRRLNEMLIEWENSLDDLDEEEELQNAAEHAEETIASLSSLLKMISGILSSRGSLSSSEEVLVNQLKGDASLAISAGLETRESIEAANQELLSAKSEVNPNALRLAQLSLENARAEIASIAAELAKTVVTAPFSGVITSIDAEVGETVSPSSSLVRVISNKSFQVEAFVPEANIARIKVGDTAEVILDAYQDDAIFEATVESISTGETLVEGVATYKVILGFESPDERIRSGMTANIDIETGKRENALSIPSRAIIEREDKKFVKIAEGEVVREVEVETGLRGSDGEIEILSGIEEGTQIVVGEK